MPSILKSLYQWPLSTAKAALKTKWGKRLTAASLPFLALGALELGARCVWPDRYLRRVS